MALLEFSIGKTKYQVYFNDNKYSVIMIDTVIRCGTTMKFNDTQLIQYLEDLVDRVVGPEYQEVLTFITELKA